MRKVPVKPKQIGKSAEERQFLKDVATYMTKIGATGGEELLLKQDGTEAPLRSRMVHNILRSVLRANY